MYVLQDPAPVTEDALAEQADALVRLGEHAEGAALRARMQSACLASDMEAFKVGKRGDKFLVCNDKQFIVLFAQSNSQNGVAC